MRIAVSTVLVVGQLLLIALAAAFATLDFAGLSPFEEEVTSRMLVLAFIVLFGALAAANQWRLYHALDLHRSARAAIEELTPLALEGAAIKRGYPGTQVFVGGEAESAEEVREREERDQKRAEWSARVRRVMEERVPEYLVDFDLKAARERLDFLPELIRELRQRLHVPPR